MITIGQERHLGRKAYFLMMSKRLIVAMVVLFVAVIVVSIQGPLVQSVAGTGGAAAGAAMNSAVNSLVVILLLSSVVVFFIGVFLAKIDYDNLTFTFEMYDLVIKKGIITRQESSVPYHHIQSVRIERTVAQQFFGVSRVILAPADGEKVAGPTGVIVLEPVDRELADDIRQTLENRMSVDVIEDRDKFTGSDAAQAPSPSQPSQQPPQQP